MAISPSTWRSRRYWPMMRKAPSNLARSKPLSRFMAWCPRVAFYPHQSAGEGGESLQRAGDFAALAAGPIRHHCSRCGRKLATRGDQDREASMTQTTNRFFDEMARLMNDAAGVASGVRREVETVFRNQADRVLRDLDVVKREEFEAVKEMA